MELDRDLSDLRFNATRNAIYHTARRLFLDRWNRRLNLVVIMAGAAVMGQLGDRFDLDNIWLGAAAAVGGALQLVFDLGVKARDHEFLQRRYYELLAEIEECVAPDAANVARWKGQLHRLYSEEPPPMRALEAVAHNAACDSYGKSHARVKVTPFQSLVRHFYPFNDTYFPDDPRPAARAGTASA